MSTLQEVISRFGAEAKRKLSNVSAHGEPEDQLRSPLEILFSELTVLCDKSKNDFAAVGESSISDLKTRPDYAITFRKALVGFVEVKAPGKGAESSCQMSSIRHGKPLPYMIYQNRPCRF